MKHNVESYWYRKCVEVGKENVEVLEEVALLALDSRKSSRKYFASLWSLRSDAAQTSRGAAYPELSNSDLFLLAKGLVLLEKRLREKNRSYIFGSASPVVPVCRFLEFRLMPQGKDALNALYAWIHLHKDQENPYTPFGALAYSSCQTIEDREAVDRYAKMRRAVHERVSAEQKRESKQRRHDGAAAGRRKRETNQLTEDVVIIDYGDEGIYVSKWGVKRFFHRVVTLWRRIQSRLSNPTCLSKL